MEINTFIALLIISSSFIFIITLVCVISSLKKKKKEREEKTTKELSNLYKMILSTNKKYNFYKDIKDISYSPCLKSKRSLDNFDLSQYVMEEIKSSKNFYETLLEKLDKNKEDFENYIKEYKAIEKYTTIEEFSKFKDIKIKYKSFNKYEKLLYLDLKLSKPVVSIFVNCHATYTSPSGRNYYWRDKIFNPNDIKNFIKNIESQEEYLLLEEERKEKEKEVKRTKEKRLRELDKLEKQLTEKEQQINQKEKEFLEATQGHIYSNQKNIDEKIEENENIVKDESPYVKLKKLKQMFDNGEIDFEEYNKRKSELI